MTILFLFLLLFLLMFIGVPIAVSLGLSGALTILLFSPDSVRSLAIKLFETSEHYTLLAIPFFLLSGAFMTTGGVARRLIDFANACVGHIRGGLAIAAVLACMLFAALSGSSPATVAAVGSIAIAGMVRSGYPQAFGGSSATPAPWASSSHRRSSWWSMPRRPKPRSASCSWPAWSPDYCWA